MSAIPVVYHVLFPDKELKPFRIITDILVFLVL